MAWLMAAMPHKARGRIVTLEAKRIPGNKIRKTGLFLRKEGTDWVVEDAY